MKTLDKAIQLATRKHGGQTDYMKEPYILHSIRVMMSMDTKSEKVVGIFVSMF